MVKREVVLAVVVAVVLAASGGYYFINVNGAGSANSTTVTIIGATTGLYGENATQFPDAFIPNNFTVKEGMHVTIVFENHDDGPHEMVIPGYGLSTGIVQGGQATRVNFIADKVGVFAWNQPQGVCDIGGLTPQQGGCTGAQLTDGNMTVTP